MGLTQEDESAVMTVNRGELAVVIWLGPQTEFPIGGNPASDSDGLRIYDHIAASKLFSMGVSVYPSVHSDYLSKSGNLDIQIAQRCNKLERSTLIPRLTNRMVIIKERMPFMFSAPNKTEPLEDSDSNARLFDRGASDFEKDNMIAFVVVVSTDRAE